MESGPLIGSLAIKGHNPRFPIWARLEKRRCGWSTACTGWSMRHTIIVSVAFAMYCVLAPGLLAAAPDFNRDVRPILSNRCFKCHGPDEDNQEAGLRLDRREVATAELDSGLTAIVPGDTSVSELVARITSEDPDLVMPPPHANMAITPRERQTLVDWVAAGAEYQPHWAFVKPVKQNPPTISGFNHPVDRFIRSRLKETGLTPANEADRATLCRRVFLDLIGLPPSPDELAEFLTDESVDSYERLVDRLLSSPRYGERWARRWLDLARYADTNGYEKDRPRTIWPYRDWVIKALNDDLPFDQFTVKQIAGDMLPDASADDIIATGFHRNTMLNEEGGVDPLEFRYLAMVDRVGTTGTTWLGLTTACAQCHTHKFDPITHTDYFSFMALLNNCDEPRWIISSADRNKQLAAAANRAELLWKQLPQQWPVPERPGRKQLAAGSSEPGQVAANRGRQLVNLAERFDAWLQKEAVHAVNWNIVSPDVIESNMPHLVPQPDGSILGSGDVTKSDVYTLTLPAAEQPVRAIRLEVLPDESLPSWGPGLCAYEGPKGSFFLSEFEVYLPLKEGRVEVAGATQSFPQPKPRAKDDASTKEAKDKRTRVNLAVHAIDGVMSSGWSTAGRTGLAEAAVFTLAEAIEPGQPIRVTLRFERHFPCSLGKFRLSATAASGAEARGLSHAEEAALVVPPPERTNAQRELLFRRFLKTAPEVSDHVREIERLELAEQRGLTTLVMRERPADNPRRTHRHHRGEFLSPEEIVPPAVPAFLPQLPADAKPDRLALARWLVSEDNPLTGRVVVNRHWHAFFGRGLVETVADFGYQGSPPSHPELLDWLAVTLTLPMEHGGLGWSLKGLHRLIVTSATYRQSSAVTPMVASRDPTNILLARGPRVRLEAEVIRDSLLKAAGLLSVKMYGPGVRPPQPAGVTEVAFGSPKWEDSKGEDRYRRGIYTFRKRTAPFAFTTTFDGPTGEACIARRDVSNSPLQALTLLNDPMFLEIARALGRKAMLITGSDSDRVQELSRLLISRTFSVEETDLLLVYLGNQRQRLADGTLSATELMAVAAEEKPDLKKVREEAAWMLVARAVMNLDEAIVKR